MSFDPVRFLHADTPVLKLRWERLTAHYDLNAAEAGKLIQGYVPDPIEQIILLSEGCANSNFKITFKSNHPPLVLRLYLRDKSGLINELNIYQFINSRIPMAEMYYHDGRCEIFPYPYAVFEWVEGALMREVIMRGDQQAIQECAYDAGKIVSQLRMMKFDQGGFFQEDFSVRPFGVEEQYIPYVQALLDSSDVRRGLDSELLSRVIAFIEENKGHLPDHQPANLTHADYDPANLLVKQDKGKWKVSAVLDWEFALASTYLLDVGLFLRYSKRLPGYYETSFIQGVEYNGSKLPPDWKIGARLMDLLCLLQLLYYNPPQKRPYLNADVVSLIKAMVLE